MLLLYLLIALQPHLLQKYCILIYELFDMHAKLLRIILSIVVLLRKWPNYLMHLYHNITAKLYEGIADKTCFVFQAFYDALIDEQIIQE